MSVFSKAKQHQIKTRDIDKGRAVMFCRHMGTKLSTDYVYLLRRNRDMPKQGRFGRTTVPTWIIRGQTTLIAEPDFPGTPVSNGPAQVLIHTTWCFTTSEDDAKYTALCNGLRSSSIDYPCDRAVTYFGGRCTNMPA